MNGTISKITKTRFQRHLKKQILTATCLVAATYSPWSIGESSPDANHGVSLQTNQFGLGLYYHHKLNERWQVRGGFTGLEGNDIDTTFSDTEFNGNWDTSSIGVILDWFPMQRGWAKNFFMSAGVLSVESEFRGKAETEIGGTVGIGGQTVLASEIDGLDLEVEHDQQFTPYIGVGWGNKIKDRGFGLSAEIGLIHLDEPNVLLTINDPNGVVSGDNLRSEENDIAEKFSGTDAMISLNLHYHF